MAVSRINEAGLNVNQYGNRNIIINGAMIMAQRGATFTAPNAAYTLDRYQVYQANGAVFDIKFSTDAPDGFESSLEIDCTTAAASPAAGAYFQMLQRIEGYNVQQLAYGTSSAKKITLSFYVKSNKTGTYQVNFRSTSATQMANKTYTINSADTWERKSVTVDGATGFSLAGGNAEGLMVDWWYHSGSDYTSGSGSETYIALAASNYNANATANLGDNTSNYLRMTGVQLEVGDTVTPFEHRTYSDELARCQRYFYRQSGTKLYYRFGVGFCTSTTNGNNTVFFPVPMRTEVSLSSSGTFAIHHGTGPSVSTTTGLSIDTQANGTQGITVDGTTTGLTVGNACQLVANNDSSAYIDYDAEL